MSLVHVNESILLFDNKEFLNNYDLAWGMFRILLLQLQLQYIRKIKMRRKIFKQKYT